MPTLSSVIVRKKGTTEPISGATVVWWDQGGRSDARSTDGSGFCNFGSLVSGGITVAVVAPAGYSNASAYKTDDADPMIIELEPSVVPFL